MKSVILDVKSYSDHIYEIIRRVCELVSLKFVSKISKKSVKNRLVEHLEICGPFSKFQYGFRCCEM